MGPTTNGAPGPRMSSKKKEEMFTEKSSFQKVYISRVSKILKVVSRFCVKRLFCPYHYKNGISKSRMGTEQTRKL